MVLVTNAMYDLCVAIVTGECDHSEELEQMLLINERAFKKAASKHNIQSWHISSTHRLTSNAEHCGATVPLEFERYALMAHYTRSPEPFYGNKLMVVHIRDWATKATRNLTVGGPHLTAKELTSFLRLASRTMPSLFRVTIRVASNSAMLAAPSKAGAEREIVGVVRLNRATFLPEVVVVDTEGNALAEINAEIVTMLETNVWVQN